MEEDKKIKRKKIFKMIYKVISYTIICILMAIAAFLIFYVISGKIAQKQGKKPLFGLYTIISPSMTGTLNVYDVAFTMRVDTDKLKEGDIITFYSTNSFFGGTPITHRIIEIVDVPDSGKMFRVKGDANPKADEEKVIPSNVVGKVLFKIPQLGRVQFFVASKAFLKLEFFDNSKKKQKIRKAVCQKKTMVSFYARMRMDERSKRTNIL